MKMTTLLGWWRRRRRSEKAALPAMSHAVIVSVDGELTFPSPSLGEYLEELERLVVAVVANSGHSRYEGREEVSSGSRLILFTSDALHLCGELATALQDFPLRYALSIRWSAEPMSAIWQEWRLDGEDP
jgi:hypothetical protein